MNHALYADGGVMNSQVAATYSPKFSVNNWISIEPSLRVKMGHKYLDPNKMEGTEQVEVDRGTAVDFYSETQNPIGRNLWYHDMGAGLLVNTKWFFAGVQVDNFFSHKDNMFSGDIDNPNRRSAHFVATAGADWKSKGWQQGGLRTMLSPYAVYQRNEELSELWAGVNFTWNWGSSPAAGSSKSFIIGIASSDQLEPAATIGMDFGSFRFMYNADYARSSMTGEQMLSHQLSLRLLSGRKNRGGRNFYN